MKKEGLVKVVFATILLVFTLSHVRMVLGGTIEIEPYYARGWTFEDFKEGSRISWEISSSGGSVDIFVTTKYEWNTRDIIDDMRKYYEFNGVIQHEGQYTVPHTDDWMFVVFNPNENSIQLTYAVFEHKVTTTPKIMITTETVTPPTGSQHETEMGDPQYVPEFSVFLAIIALSAIISIRKRE